VRVENKFGVLSRISGLFSGRGYNISSLTVNSTSDPEVSRMIIVTRGDDAVIEQIEKQLNKLVEVIRVDRLSGEEFIERELALFKLAADTPEKKAQVIQLVEIFNGSVVSVSRDAIAVELSGRSDRIDDFMELIRDFEVIDMARSGRVAIARCANPATDVN
jgi:acetolactate synthase-1/3 small subunit